MYSLIKGYWDLWDSKLPPKSLEHGLRMICAGIPGALRGISDEDHDVPTFWLLFCHSEGLRGVLTSCLSGSCNLSHGGFGCRVLGFGPARLTGGCNMGT